MTIFTDEMRRDVLRAIADHMDAGNLQDATDAVLSAIEPHVAPVVEGMRRAEKYVRKRQTTGRQFCTFLHRICG